MSPAPERLTVAALTLTDLRNYSTLSVRFEAGLVVLTGENGAGKTNLLEALSLLTPGRGLRRAAFEEITRHGAARGWAVAATLQRGDAETKLGTGLVEGSGGEGKSRAVRIDGATAQNAEAMLEHLRVLWLTPAMDGLFTGPGSERRRFLDRLVLTLDPAHARRAREFERLLTQRNRLLDENASGAWLDAVETELAERAVAVALARAETAALLSARLAQHPEDASAFPVGRIALTGAFDAAIVGMSASAAELAYRERLARSRNVDRAAGRTLDGPHRSDLAVTFAAKAMPAALSSTGEQKALLIGLILAHAELSAEASGMRPVLLLDEVVAHLDPGRRAALFARLSALGGQAFLTGTDAVLFAGLPADSAHFHVSGGRLSQAG